MTGTAPPATLDPALELGAFAQLRTGRLPRRLAQLFVGLALYGVSLACLVRADLGVAPWDVLHSGLIRYVPITLGQAVIAMSFVVLLAWVPLRERPGVGTLANALVVGVAADATLVLLDRPGPLVLRLLLMATGIALCGLATAVYMGAQLGRGPRDGLMTGLSRRTGLSLRLVRTGLELAVVAVGLVLGGRLGVGTLAFAVLIGPVTQALVPAFLVRPAPRMP